MESPRRVDVEMPLWPLAALCGLLPLVTAHTGWLVSTVQGLIPACNPYIDGCASISRASRHCLASQLFRMLMLPAATLQGLCWIAVACWLKRYASRNVSVAWLGAVAAIALIAYATFLGTDGSTYEILRRYGIYFCFGCSYLALLASLGVLARHRQQCGTYRPLMVIAGVCLGLALQPCGQLLRQRRSDTRPFREHARVARRAVAHRDVRRAGLGMEARSRDRTTVLTLGDAAQVSSS